MTTTTMIRIVFSTVTAEPGLTEAEVADRTHLDAATASRVLRSLREMGSVSYEHHPSGLGKLWYPVVDII